MATHAHRAALGVRHKQLLPRHIVLDWAGVLQRVLKRVLQRVLQEVNAVFGLIEVLHRCVLGVMLRLGVLKGIILELEVESEEKQESADEVDCEQFDSSRLQSSVLEPNQVATDALDNESRHQKRHLAHKLVLLQQLW